MLEDEGESWFQVEWFKDDDKYKEGYMSVSKIKNATGQGKMIMSEFSMRSHKGERLEIAASD